MHLEIEDLQELEIQHLQQELIKNQSETISALGEKMQLENRLRDNKIQELELVIDTFRAPVRELQKRISSADASEAQNKPKANEYLRG